MELQKATRRRAKIRLCLQGPSGSGKTYSSLLIAHGMCNDWSKVAVIDSENNSADLYAHLGAYNTLSIEAPFTPEKYIEAIKVCENAGIEVIILDSVSHEWDGSGGILDIHGNMPGNSFANWSKVTPRHNSFVQAILQSSCHIINSIFAIDRVWFFVDSFMVTGSSVLRINICAEKPAHHKSAKRWQ